MSPPPLPPPAAASPPQPLASAAPQAPAPRRRLALSFTGGKDCVLAAHLCSLDALATARGGGGAPVPVTAAAAALGAPHAGDIALLVTFGPENAETAFRAHPLPLIRAQAAALGLPHIFCAVAAPFVDSYRAHIARLREEHGIEGLVTGDICDVCESFMPRAVEGTGVALVRPLWGLERGALLGLVFDMGIQAVISCVNVAAVGEAAAAALLGSALTPALRASVLAPLAAAPPAAPGKRQVDEAGEWGEFHTACLAAPLFRSRLALPGATHARDGDYAFLVMPTIATQ
jgi:diphthamide synthase (EF-2-diphthine--ammonia ligase)